MKDSTSHLNNEKLNSEKLNNEKLKNEKKAQKLALSMGVGFFWVAVWYLIYRLVGRDVLIPSPFHVLGRLLELAGDASFWRDVVHSIVRIGVGLAVSVIVGFVGGACSSVSTVVHHLFKPILTIITATPVVSFIIITLVWFPSSQVVVFITFLMCVPIIWNNTRKGVQSTDSALVEMSKFYRVSTANQIKWLYIPSLMPYLSAAMSSVFGLAWKVGVAAEVLSHPKWGIGTQLYRSKINLDSESLFAWTAVVVLLSVLFETLLARLFLQRQSTSKRRKKPIYATEDCFMPVEPEKRHVTIPSYACRVRNVNFRYGERSILDEFSQDFEGGRVHCLFGPSGSGKTTLLRLLAGILEPSGGKIEWTPSPLQGTGLMKSYVFQEDRLLPWATVYENLSYVLHPSVVSEQEGHKRIACILRAIRLEGFAEALPFELSGGMRQRVNIARALIVHPNVLFLDEAFKGLDPELKTEVIELVQSYTQMCGATVWMATHDIEEARRLESGIYELDGPPLRRK